MKKLSRMGLLLVMTLGLLIPSCKTNDTPGPDNPNNPPSSITLPDKVDFQSEASEKLVQVGDLPSGWQVKSSKSWCTPTPMGKTLKIAVQTNDDTEVREAELQITYGTNEKKVLVRQLGTAPAILVDKQIFTLSASGEVIDFVITTNTQIEVKLPDWVKKPSGLRAMCKENHSYLAQPNIADANRTGQIEITQTGIAEGTTPVKAFISLTQLGVKGYTAGSTKELAEDEQIKVVSGTASSYQNGQGIEKSFDGDMATIYHSSWNNNVENYFPITLTYSFAEASDVDYLVYYPRTSGSNGHFKQVLIEYSEDGNTFHQLVDKDFGGTGQPTRVVFDQRVKAKTFRFTVKSGAGDRKGFASCAEMKFFKRSDKVFDYKTLFADELCTTLRPEVTDEMIAQCTDPFFRNLAFFIKQGKYSQEFRVASFKPYLDPRVISARNKTYPYSQLDNPTGISVKQGEDLIVFVEDTHGFEGLSLRVQNLDKPGGDGFGGVYYPLYKGLNKLKMTTPGLAYVMYHTRDEAKLPSLQPIRMHFATGTVNGYYDAHDPKLKDRWRELLDKASDKYFDVLGLYCHLTFETNDFRQYTPNGSDITETYDSIVYNEWVLHGVIKYDKKPVTRRPQNRSYLHVMYHQFMYATWFHTAYTHSTNSSILDPNKMRNPESQSAAWGPAHEIGHTNQTRPGLLWIGLTECTVNIPSEYITTYVFHQPSRLQSERLGEFHNNNRYTKGFTKVFAGDIPFCKAGDVFVQLIPFWQLELYFGKVLGRTPRQNPDKVSGFYPDLYEYFRVHEDQKTPGEQQTEFPFAVSTVSGFDMTRFFERWGYFKPVDTEIDDYGKGRMKVEKARADAVKQRIADLHLPKLDDIALEYITDDNSYLYKDRPDIIPGSKATIAGKTITITDWRNVVAYEVYNAEGRLIFVADASYYPGKKGKTSYATDYKTAFNMPDSWVEGNTIKAVSAGNKRVDVPTK